MHVWISSLIFPIMLALCLIMLSETYYAQNYAGIIGLGLVYTDCCTVCPLMCNKPQPLFCTLQCVPGCQCLSGTVLDELQNKCVKPDECSKNILLVI